MTWPCTDLSNLRLTTGNSSLMLISLLTGLVGSTFPSSLQTLLYTYIKEEILSLTTTHSVCFRSPIKTCVKCKISRCPTKLWPLLVSSYYSSLVCQSKTTYRSALPPYLQACGYFHTTTTVQIIYRTTLRVLCNSLGSSPLQRYWCIGEGPEICYKNVPEELVARPRATLPSI